MECFCFDIQLDHYNRPEIMCLEFKHKANWFMERLRNCFSLSMHHPMLTALSRDLIICDYCLLINNSREPGAGCDPAKDN